MSNLNLTGTALLTFLRGRLLLLAACLLLLLLGLFALKANAGTFEFSSFDQPRAGQFTFTAFDRFQSHGDDRFNAIARFESFERCAFESFDNPVFFA